LTDSKQRFSNRVQDYVRYRPGYPAALVPIIAEELGWDGPAVIADIGSGTGFSAEPFLDHGHRVLAVEPNEDMRRAAEGLFGERPGFESVAGSAEETGLEVESVDAVVAGQAFHWFDAEAARAEFTRILRAPKWVVLFWNVRLTHGTPFLEDYETLLQRFGTDYEAVRHEHVDDTALRSFFGGDYVRRTAPNEQRFDLEALEGRVRSSSYTPPPGHPDYEPMMAALRELFDRDRAGGEVRMPYRTEIFIGRLSPPDPRTTS
jgi:SAM-dependent methyltransferase